jgi:hypothetical protein
MRSSARLDRREANHHDDKAEKRRYPLSDIQKSRGVESSRCLLLMFQVQEQKAWHNILTLDGSLLYCGTGYKSMWLPFPEKFARCHVSLLNTQD